MEENTKIQDLSNRINKLDKKIHLYEDKQKILKSNISQMTRKERAHHLITRGAMLEAYLPQPEEIDDEQLKEFLKMVLGNEKIKQLILKCFDHSKEDKVL